MLYQFNFIEGVYDINDVLAEKIRKEINITNKCINEMKAFFKDDIPSYMKDEFDRTIMKYVCKVVEKYFLKDYMKYHCCYCYTPPIEDELNMYEAKIIKLEES